ncbi:hypothetical protein AYM40_26825 [Paraburkholderia phytofirmans OLGA172]|uniref:DUF4148 domain-containing protein n=1 Tax=Paraburkholderia phytofirmans OLGA172 TaxID=1417228 RepID=A0A161ICH9_9BURK|nr:hypothetical protein AYM40_09705 [Paraburkholderia phytofirmans OLGA172]ANB75913.1 hypothetical protein AYM40_26825 [Paraburkholderia phytofirmans OLGA172]
MLVEPLCLRGREVTIVNKYIALTMLALAAASTAHAQYVPGDAYATQRNEMHDQALLQQQQGNEMARQLLQEQRQQQEQPHETLFDSSMRAWNSGQQTQRARQQDNDGPTCVTYAGQTSCK